MSTTQEEDKDKKIADLQSKVSYLEELLNAQCTHTRTYYSSPHAVAHSLDLKKIPQRGMAASHVREIIEQYHSCDFNPRLNTSSYVNVVSELDEREVAMLGAQVNLADASVYPASVKIHDAVVNMIAELWNAPEPDDGSGYIGAGTVGSTEACLLAGLALKFRWRDWYSQKEFGAPNDERVLGVRPNLVISTCYQAAWEKFFRYFDVQPRFCKPNLFKNSMSVDAKELCALCDDKTIGVVAILGNHYNGAYDPVWDINDEIQKLNTENNWQLAIHIDAASGGFVAPFQSEMDKPFDFRLPNVISISSSGHKFGESICGTGWLIFRQREDLADHIAITVTYLGGHCDSMTLNFSRPASGVYVQYYKLVRLGWEGYHNKIANQMKVAKFLRDYLRAAKNAEGVNYFEILDGGDTCCLPVVAGRLNPNLNMKYDDIDLQHALSESHWYVSGYALGFEDPSDPTGQELSLCKDCDPDCTMFRIVVKSNLTMSLAKNLRDQFEFTLPTLDSLQDGYASMHMARQAMQVVQESRASEQESKMVFAAVGAMKAARKWSSARKSAKDKILGITLEELAELANEDEEGGGDEKAMDTSSSSKMKLLRSRRRGSVHQVC